MGLDFLKIHKEKVLAENTPAFLAILSGGKILEMSFLKETELTFNLIKRFMEH